MIPWRFLSSGINLYFYSPDANDAFGYGIRPKYRCGQFRSAGSHEPSEAENLAFSQ